MNKMKLIELIARHTREVLPRLEAHQFIPSDRLVELGANSVDRAELAMVLPESLRLSVSRIRVFRAENVGKLAELFLQKLDAV